MSTNYKPVFPSTAKKRTRSVTCVVCKKCDHRSTMTPVPPLDRDVWMCKHHDKGVVR